MYPNRDTTSKRLRKMATAVAQDYPKGIFRLLCCIIETREWTALSLIHTTANIPPLDLIYGLVNPIYLRDKYGIEGRTLPISWKLYLKVSNIYQSIATSHPFCIVQTKQDIGCLLQIYPLIRIYRLDRIYDVVILNNYLRLMRLLSAQDTLQLCNHKTVNGSPFVTCGGREFIQQLLTYTPGDLSGLPRYRRDYFRSILRMMGEDEVYSDIVCSVVRDRDASPEIFTKALFSLKYQVRRTAEGTHNNMRVSSEMLFRAVCLLTPVHYYLLYDEGMRVERRTGYYRVYDTYSGVTIIKITDNHDRRYVEMVRKIMSMEETNYTE